MKLSHNGKVIVGFDLTDSYAQISYMSGDGSNVETISSVAGTEAYNIPAVLCKKEGANQWFYGKEALRYAEAEKTPEAGVSQNGGILVENLLSLAVSGEPLQIEGETYQPEALLTLFVKRCLGMLSQVVSPEKVQAFMFTCEKPDSRVLEVLGQVIAGLSLKPEKVYIQSHMESFYYYMLYQPEELWRMQTLLCQYEENSMRIYRMECNRRTTPVVVHVDEAKYPFLSYEPMPVDGTMRKGRMERLDEEFLHLLEGVCQNQMISAAYLIGEQFSEEWMKESLRYLCKGRRVFQGNNLYSKGACYGMQERLQQSALGKEYVFLGKDKLKTNIGMKVLRRGQASYYALLDAGVNWYEAEETLEFYLQEGNTVELVLTSLIGGNNRLAEITLEGLPEGPCRLGMHLYLEDEKHLIIELEDLGFGVFRPATNRTWREELELING